MGKGKDTQSVKLNTNMADELNHVPAWQPLLSACKNHIYRSQAQIFQEVVCGLACAASELNPGIADYTGV